MPERYPAPRRHPGRGPCGTRAVSSRRDEPHDSNAELAERFVLSEATVKAHVARVLGELGLRDRVQAAVLAYETGVVGR
ncbi:response regulator transcription factor [Protaetiibacter larvae]|uniref:response regulator transcription factor n=1 Tax=Protaetiibacter larvae TaxID=2592654 RepID=UPI003CCC8270